MATGTYSLSDWGSSSQKISQNILPPGVILQSRYEVMRVLGVGGMGAVYLAQDLRFTGVVRYCAVKEMIIATPDPNTRRLAVESFNREANLLVELSNPGIPKIYDFFNEGNRSYVVMEHVEGDNLEHILDNTGQQLREDTVLDWAIQICDVLTYLHSQKPPIIFRDLKPANIMLRKQNRIALIDFGIAKAFEAGQKGTMIGTEGYSPPEQYKGIADPRVDIYALSATLHHLLTKRDPRLEPPFSFEQAPMQSLNPEISDQAAAVIAKGLEYNAENRHPTAKAFKESIQEVLNGKRTNSGISATRSDTQTLPADTGMLPPVQPAPAQTAPAVTQPMAYPPNYPPPGYAYPPGYPMPPGYPVPPGYAMPGYPQGFPGQPEEEEVQEATALWKFKCEDEVRASPSSDGKQLYIGSYDGNMYALDLKTGEEQWKYKTDGGIVTKPFVYQDRIIFGSEDQFVYAISLTGRMLWTCPTKGKVRSSATVDFDRAFFGSDDRQLYAISAQNGSVMWTYHGMGPIRSTPAITGKAVYFGLDDGELCAVEIRTGKRKWQFNAKKAITSSPLLYKEQLVIVGSFDRQVYGIHQGLGEMVWQVRTGQPVISSPVLFDNTVFVGSVDGTLYMIHPETGRILWKYEAGSQIVSTPAVTEDAVYIGTGSGEVHCIDREERKLRWKFTTNGPVPSSPLVVDDVVYIGSTDNHVYALPA